MPAKKKAAPVAPTAIDTDKICETILVATILNRSKNINVALENAAAIMEMINANRAK